MEKACAFGKESPKEGFSYMQLATRRQTATLCHGSQLGRQNGVFEIGPNIRTSRHYKPLGSLISRLG